MRAFRDFNEAAEIILAHLQKLFPLDLWMVTRTESDDWIVLEADDQGYGIHRGDVLRWSDSFCARMTAGDGPNIATDANEIKSYREAPIGRQVEIGCYVGYPLRLRDGSLVGTLCGIDPRPGDPRMEKVGESLEILARLLASLLEHELEAEAISRSFNMLHDEAHTDYLTGVRNRRAWEKALETAEHRCRNLGSPAVVIYIDLDELKRVNDGEGHEAGDRLIQAAAKALNRSVRKQDLLARIGGDEFGVLSLECDQKEVGQIKSRIHHNLVQAGIKASVGVSVRNPRGNIWDAVQEADQKMYERKRAARG